jgi:5'(3')-deoxyribonucleotidase
MKPIILLDMDGVVCDFVSAACVACGHPGHAVTGWDFNTDFGMTMTEFWAAIDAQGLTFWRDLKEYPGFWRMYRELVKQADVIFLTTPSQSPYCISGKLQWLQERFGQDFRDFSFTPRKELLAGPDRILIDDSDSNIATFAAHGGRTILWPQPWNAAAGQPLPSLARLFG